MFEFKNLMNFLISKGENVGMISSKNIYFCSKNKKLGVNCFYQNSRKPIFNLQFSINFQFSILKIPWNFKFDNSKNRPNSKSFLTKHAHWPLDWGMFRISFFLIFKSCPVCFFNIWRIWQEMWCKKWNLPQGFCLLLKG